MTNAYLNTTTRNAHWFKKAHEAGELQMKPPFQRNPVWTDKQKSFLIDTILSGLPIPEVYMQDTVNEGGEANYIVVDGQQRLRAVLEFMEGRFALDPKDSPSWGDMEFDDLSPKDKKQIYRYDFVVRQLPDLDDSQIRKIFQRLNRNVVALNKQELRQATYWGPFINLMNSISDWDEWGWLGVFSANDIRRMLDVEFISELAVAVLNGHQNKKAKLDQYYEIYEQSFEDGPKLQKVFRRVLGEIEEVLPEISKHRWSKKTDFYTLFLVLAKHHDKLPMTADKRATAAELLVKFGAHVDQFVKADDTNKPKLSQAVSSYGANVRNSADLGSRRKRFEALEEVLAPVL